MTLTRPCTYRPAAAARAGSSWLLTLLLLFSAPALLSAADERVVQRGAKASAPVKPNVIKVDLRNLPLVPEWQAGDGIKEIPRRHTHPPRFKDPLGPTTVPQEDPLLTLQEAVPIVLDAPSPSVTFAGQNFTGVNPPDTVGDVSPLHFVQAINHSSGTSVTVYNKTGGVAAGPFILDTLVAGGTCASGLGDPVVLYDHLASRWLLSEFSSSGNALCVYISQTSNPVSGGWFRYVFTAPTFPDYPKYGVWPDAYYVGTNENSPSVYAFDRNRMLAGLSATMQRFTAPDLPGFGFQMVTPADLDGATPPPSGARGIFMRHRDDESHPPASAGQDFLQLFEFHVDWTTPANSTFTGPINIAVSEFDSNLCGLTSFNCVPQPSGPTLDPLREVVMFRLQYRNFGAHQTLVGNLVTDVNGTDRHGIRWFELRKTGASWGLHQEGTFSPDATHRWMGSAAMDSAGNIMVGYNASSSSVFPGLRYAGRLASDPAGTLAQGETVLRNGTAANASNRWGDYAAMTVDPGDNCTFWFTGQYSPGSSWGTWIGAFKFPNCGSPTPDFSVACAPSSLSVAQGGSGNSTCTVTSTNGFASAVNLACTGLPAGASCGFSPNPVTPPANSSSNSALSVSVGGAVAPGTYAFQAQGTSGGNTRTFNMSLTVTAVPTPDFSIACSPASLSVQQGSSGNSACTVTSTNGFASAVSLACTGLPAGASCGFSPNPVTPPANSSSNSALSVSVGGAVAPGTYAFQARGTNGGNTRTFNMSLTVTSVPTPDFSIACSPASLSVAQGSSGNSTCTVTSTNGFASAVGLDCASLPAGVTCGYVPASVTPPAGGTANSALTVSVGGSVATGSYNFQARGTSGGTTRTFNVSLTVTGTGGGDLTAVFDPTLQAPRCATVGRSCDSGAALLLGRDGKGPEPNQPNTINDSCVDGTSGTFHSDESNDRLKVSTTDGSDFAPGKTVRIDATAWAWTSPSGDKLDLYYAANASSPVWTFLTTLTPTIAGSQVLTATYTLPTGGLQAVRAQFRYQGSASPCTAGGFNDRDDLIFAVNSPTGPPDNTATFDAALQAPRCSAAGRSCDSGPSLLLGRAALGPEPNQPNTISDSCADGASGTFHSDESLDRLKVLTTDGTALAAGKTVRIEAGVWAWTTPSADSLDLYYTANAASPTWTFLTTLTPSAAGAQTLSATYTLPAGSLQAVRARFRYQGAASSCTTGNYDDHDDLIFAVP